MAQAHNTHVKLINKFTEDIKNCLLVMKVSGGCMTAGHMWE